MLIVVNFGRFSTAISHFPNSHNPYTLIRRSLLRTERYGEGDEWVEQAIQRGTKPNDQDSEIKRILNLEMERGWWQDDANTKRPCPM